MNQIKLKTSSILNVPIHNYEDDFTFIVNGKEFKTNKIISDLISPNVSRHHQTDPTFETYCIDTQVEGDFSLILQLANFNNVTIPESEIRFVAEAVDKLGNESIEINIENQASNLTKDNALNILKFHLNDENFYTKMISSETDFISSHFYEIVQTEEIETLPQSIINRIISNNLLRLKDEDQLLTFINKLYQNDRKNCELYEFVNFSNLCTLSIQEFLSVFNIDDINQSIWLSISQRLQAETIVNQTLSDRLAHNFIENIDIFAHLRKEAKGENPATAKLIDVSASSVLYGQPSILIDDNPKSRFETKDQKNSFILFDFKTRKVSLNSYSIRTHSTIGNGHITGWTLLGSNDLNNWDKIDEVEETSAFDSGGVEKKFKLQNNSQLYRYIELKQTKPNSKSFNNLRLSGIQLFGSIQY